MSVHSLPNFSWLDGPGPYKPAGPSSEDVRDLVDKRAEGKNHLGLKPSLAAKLAIDEVEKHRRDDLWISAWSGARSPQVKLQLPIRVFHQLDKELFRGVLKGHVLLTTPDLHSRVWSSSIHSATSKAGGQYPRITIGLNPLVYKLDAATILACLIHQMTHAYFLVCCGFGIDQGHDLRHGLPYSALLYTIQHRFLPEKSMYSFPNLFQCCLNHKRHAARPPRVPPADGYSLCFWNFVREFDWGECRRYRETLKELTLAKPEEEKKRDEQGEPKKFPIEDRYPRSDWFHIFPPTPLPTLVPRRRVELLGHCAVAANSFIELHYQGKAVPVDAHLLLKFPTFRASVVQSLSNRILTVPKDVDEKTFLSVYKFLCCSSYDPPPTLSLSAGGPKVDTGSGTLHTKGGSVPIEDFRVYAVAQKIGFEELKKYALVRMYSQTMLKGHPMDFLDEVYTGKKPEKDAPFVLGKDWKPDDGLRKFIRAFLTADHPDTASSLREAAVNLWVGGGGLQLGFPTQSNLGIIKNKDEWRERLRKLRAGGGAFLEDLDQAEEALKEGRRINVPNEIRSNAWLGGVSGNDFSTAALRLDAVPGPAPGLGLNADIGGLGGALGLGFGLGVDGMGRVIEEHAMAGALPIRLAPPQAAARGAAALGARGLPGVMVRADGMLIDAFGRPILTRL